jgi:hypothetical protein
LSDSGGVFTKQDTGSSTNWKKLPTATNFNTNNFDANIGGVSTSDATNFAIAHETFSEIKGIGSLRINKAASNESGEYVTLKSFYIDPVHEYSAFEVCLGLGETTSTFEDDDLRVTIFNATQGNFIRAAKEYIKANANNNQQCFGPFQMNLGTDNYQVRLYVDNTDTNAYSILIDGFDEDEWYVGPVKSKDEKDPIMLEVTCSSSQNWAPWTTNTIQFNTIVNDTAGAFNTGTYTYTIPESGFYRVDLKILMTATPADTHVYDAIIYKNAAEALAMGRSKGNTVAEAQPQVHYEGYFAKGETVYFALYNGSNGTMLNAFFGRWTKASAAFL